MPILFLIYINAVFEKVTESYLAIISLLLIDDLSFIAFEYLIKELAKILGKILIVILDWKKSNIVIYDVAKIKAVLFFKLHCQRLNKQIARIYIKLEFEKIKYNKEAT